MATETISKAAAVREAFKALGNDASGNDIAAWIKKKYGLEVGSANISQEKCRLKTPGSNGSAPVAAAPVATVPVVEDEALEGVEALFAMKALAKKVGGVAALKGIIAEYEKLTAC